MLLDYFEGREDLFQSTINPDEAVAAGAAIQAAVLMNKDDAEDSKLGNPVLLDVIPLTLGLVYASSGLGCVVGPMAIGALTGSSEGDYKRALGVAFFLSSAAYLFLSFASSLGPVLASSFLRACASSVIWIYSTYVRGFYFK